MKILLLLCALELSAADGWVELFNKKNLDGWEVIGNGLWTVMRDGTLLGQRDFAPGLSQAQPVTERQFRAWRDTQSWLYTKKEYGEFDLHLEFWLRYHGNSGVSIRDSSRAKYGVTTPPDYTRTPSKIGYEIQINNLYPDQYPTGSIYTFQKAKTGVQIDNDWNAMDIESRNDMIRVRLNGQLVAEHPGDPARPKIGPIGLQLHDQFCVIMFRNVRIREVK